MDPLREQLEEAVRLRARYYENLGDRHYACPEDLVLREGRFERGATQPKRYGLGRQKRCFANALELATAHPELSYCEGYAMQVPLPLAVHHAWCVDERGRVIEPTWRFDEEYRAENALYMGIAFPVRMVASSLLDRNYAGVIDNFEHKHPLLRRPLAESLAEWREGIAALSAPG